MSHSKTLDFSYLQSLAKFYNKILNNNKTQVSTMKQQKIKRKQTAHSKKPQGSKGKPIKKTKQASSSGTKKPVKKQAGSASKSKFDKKGPKKGHYKKQKQSHYNPETQENENQEDNFKEQKGEQLNSFGFVDKQRLLSMNTEKQIKTIRQIFEKITLNPELNFKQVETLFVLTKTPNLKVVCVALRTLAETFVNVAPLESIDLRRLDSRAEHKVTKEEFSVIRFQKMLVEQYDRFIRMLKEFRSKTKKQNFGEDIELFTQFRKCILNCAVTCFDALWNFNLSRQLCDLLVNFIKFKQCRQSFERLLRDKNMATFSIKAKIINCISQLIKKKSDSELPDDLIKMLNSTYIDSNYLQKDRDVLNFKKKKLKKRIYKQQAHDKKMQKQKAKQNPDKLQQKRKKRTQKMQLKMKIKEEINKQFAEGEATISNKELVKHNSNILQQLFYVFFKVLVDKTDSKFLRDVLDGILNFAHLINIDLISSMIEHLSSAGKIFRELWKGSKSLDHIQTRLIIVFTMESILNGPLSVYNMDDHSVTSNFYQILRDINATSKTAVNKQVFRMICISLDEVFIKKRQLSIEIVGSFVREISIFLTRKEVPKLFLLEFLRLLGSKYHKVNRMFEEDNEGFGINSYNQACEDPQSTNAINTEILTNLKSIKSYDKAYKQYRDDVQKYLVILMKQNFHRIQGTEPLNQILLNDIAVGFECE